MFHQLITGDDRAQAQYYADHYLPRLFESYTSPTRNYPIVLVISTFYLIERSIITVRLIRRSTDNCDGYKQIDAIQLNATFLTVLNWNIKDWWRFLKASREHRKICTDRDQTTTAWTSNQERTAHLYVNQRLADNIDDMDSYELSYCNNPIDFSHCYRFHGLDISRLRPNILYKPQAFCRIDMPELSWFVYYFFFGVPILLVAMASFMLIALSVELVALVPDGDQITIHGYLRQIPNLFTDLNRLIRLIDIYTLVIAQMPLQNQTSAIALDIATLISRVNKVTDLLNDDLKFCVDRAHEYKNSILLAQDGTKLLHVHEDLNAYVSKRNGSLSIELSKSSSDYFARGKFTNISRAERNLLANRLRFNLRLAHVVRTEFVALKRSHSSYLNILIAGSGFFVAAAFALLLLIPQSLEQAMLFIGIVAGIVPLVVLSPLCVEIQNSVSIYRQHTLMITQIDHTNKYYTV